MVLNGEQSSPTEAKRVLSIQSHVVCGYVGNKAACFPLQLLGYDVDPVNSVHFSNNTSYPHVSGRDQVLKKEQLRDLISGLEKNSITSSYSHVLTGYVGDPGFLLQIREEVQSLKRGKPGLTYLCDPVLGDHGSFYVPESLVQLYRDEVLRVADVVTPNDFELRQLTSSKCEDLKSTLEAIKKLHTLGPKTVVLTSIALPQDAGKLRLICSCKTSGQLVTIVFPRIEQSFTGTGDLFSALFLAYSSQHDIRRACEKSVAALFQVLQNTVSLSSCGDASSSTAAGGGGGGLLELKLIQSKHIIENPSIVFKCSTIPR